MAWNAELYVGSTESARSMRYTAVSRGLLDVPHTNQSCFGSRSKNSSNRTRTLVSLNTTTSLWKQHRWASIPWSIIRASVYSWIDLSLSKSLPADERTSSGAENPPASTASHWLISLHLIINLLLLLVDPSRKKRHFKIAHRYKYKYEVTYYHCIKTQL